MKTATGRSHDDLTDAHAQRGVQLVAARADAEEAPVRVATLAAATRHRQHDALVDVFEHDGDVIRLPARPARAQRLELPYTTPRLDDKLQSKTVTSNSDGSGTFVHDRKANAKTGQNFGDANAPTP